MERNRARRERRGTFSGLCGGAILFLLLPWPARAQAGHFWFQRRTPAPTSTPVRPTPTPAPTPEAGCAIDVLEHEPAVPFDLVGIVEVQSRDVEPDGEGLLPSARARACELGGDALVILYRREGRRGGLPPETRRGRMLPYAGLRAAVIRYRNRPGVTAPASP